MKGTISVFIVTAKSWLRSASGVFFSLMFPLMLLLIFGFIFGGVGTSSYNLQVQNRDVVDNEPTILSNQLVNALENMEALNIKHIDPNRNIDDYVEENPSHRILVIPENLQQKATTKSMYIKSGVVISTLEDIIKNFDPIGENNIQSIERGIFALEQWRSHIPSENVYLLFMSSEEDQATQIVRSIVFNFVRSFNNKMIEAEEIINLNTKSTVPEDDIGQQDYYLPGLMAAFIMTNGVMGVTTNTSEFRRNGVLKRIAATPLRKSSLILGNLLTQTEFAFVLALLMIGVGWIVFGIQVTINLSTILLIVLGATAFCGMGLVLGGMIKDTETANAAGTSIGFPMMFLSGAFWPMEMMPGFLQTVAKALPVYYLHEGLRQSMLYNNIEEALPSIAIVGALSIIFIALAVKVTKWKEF